MYIDTAFTNASVEDNLSLANKPYTDIIGVSLEMNCFPTFYTVQKTNNILTKMNFKTKSVKSNRRGFRPCQTSRTN